MTRSWVLTGPMTALCVAPGEQIEHYRVLERASEGLLCWGLVAGDLAAGKEALTEKATMEEAERRTRRMNRGAFKSLHQISRMARKFSCCS